MCQFVDMPWMHLDYCVLSEIYFLVILLTNFVALTSSPGSTPCSNDRLHQDSCGSYQLPESAHWSSGKMSQYVDLRPKTGLLLKVAQLAKSKIEISFTMRYVVSLGLQNLELTILFQSNIRLLRYYKNVLRNQQRWQQLSFFFIFFELQLPILQLIIYA